MIFEVSLLDLQARGSAAHLLEIIDKKSNAQRVQHLITQLLVVDATSNVVSPAGALPSPESFCEYQEGGSCSA